MDEPDGETDDYSQKKRQRQQTGPGEGVAARWKDWWHWLFQTKGGL
jgi:hypothetical protein